MGKNPSEERLASGDFQPRARERTDESEGGDFQPRVRERTDERTDRELARHRHADGPEIQDPAPPSATEAEDAAAQGDQGRPPRGVDEASQPES